MKLADPKDVGMDPERLNRISGAVTEDIANNQYDGAVLAIGRRGKLVFHEAIGYAERDTGRKTQTDDVFSIMSITKSMSTAVILDYFERGKFSLTTQVADIIPEFGAVGKKRITIAQLLAHTGGMSHGLPPLPMEQLGDLEAVVKAVCTMSIEAPPGEQVSYSPIISQSVLAEVVRRVDGGHRSYREIMEEVLFKPLSMHDTSLGQRADLEDRRVPIVVRDRGDGFMAPEFLEALNAVFREGSEVPAAGGYSTTLDVYRFAEMLRGGGSLDGARILSPVTIDFARQNHTGEKTNSVFTFVREHRGWNEWPAYLGLGFYLRGEMLYPDHYGVLASPGTFGHVGVGSAVFWIDPKQDMVFVGLTSGLMEESRSLERWQRLSDIALSSIVDQATS